MATGIVSCVLTQFNAPLYERPIVFSSIILIKNAHHAIPSKWCKGKKHFREMHASMHGCGIIVF